MTTVEVRAFGWPDGARLVRLCGLLLAGLTTSVVLGALMFYVGMKIEHFDATRHHVPGRLLYGSLWVLPGVLQWLYLVPIGRWARRSGHIAFFRGLLCGAALIILFNVGLGLLALAFEGMD